jgi:3-deoxy-D-manno-octulosonic-acid transferase
MIWLYRLLYLPALVIALPYYLFRMWRRGGYGRDFRHRFGAHGKLPAPTAGRRRIWIQAVSVGEVLAVRPLIEALQNKDSFEIVLTTTTSTGYREARKHYAKSIRSVGIFPLDFWLFSCSAWRCIRPDAIVLTESELWPEHLHQARVRGIPAFLVNARMSDKSFGRYRKVAFLSERLLRKFESIYAASQTDADHFLALGAGPEGLHLYGSIKLDVPTPTQLDEPAKTDLLQQLGFWSEAASSPVILLGSSTWPGEEIALCEITARLIEKGLDCRLLLVPRHAERGPEIVKHLRRQALPWHRRSTGAHPESPATIHLADTTGELSRLTQIADIVFIGKSLPPNRGGQSPVDAAGLGRPIVFGPNMDNFKDIARMLAHAGAARCIADEVELEEELNTLCRDPVQRTAMGEAGAHWHRASQGSSRRIADSITALLKT